MVFSTDSELQGNTGLTQPFLLCSATPQGRVATLHTTHSYYLRPAVVMSLTHPGQGSWDSWAWNTTLFWVFFFFFCWFAGLCDSVFVSSHQATSDVNELSEILLSTRHSRKDFNKKEQQSSASSNLIMTIFIRFLFTPKCFLKSLFIRVLYLYYLNCRWELDT